MAHLFHATGPPIPEKVLKELSKDVSALLPDFSAHDRESGMNEIHAVFTPLLDTADTIEINSSHRASACNLICAVIERCQISHTAYAVDAILDDSVWDRLFNIFLERSDDAKSKSVRQVLLVLTGVLSKSSSPRSQELQHRAATTFIDIICRRKDRLKVKPALQGLSNLLQKEIVCLNKLFSYYREVVGHQTDHLGDIGTAQVIFAEFLAWIVHHDTSLSAGHLLKNYLIQLRNWPQLKRSDRGDPLPIWLRPVVEYLNRWPDRMQEFKTHVFPHCFLPNLHEYLQFLSFLHFEKHVETRRCLPAQLRSNTVEVFKLEKDEEFRVLLSSIEKAKELGIVKDIDYRLGPTVKVQDDVLLLPDDVFGGWLAHMEPDVRLAGLYLSIYSTAVTKPITGGVLRSLKRNLVHLHSDSDANFRRELVGYTQKLFDRLRGSTSTLVKSKVRGSGTGSQARLTFPRAAFTGPHSPQYSSNHNPLIEALRFVAWYLRFLENDLRPDASYQRRISALRALAVVLKSGLDPRVPHHYLSKRAQGQLHWMHQLQIPNVEMCRSLLDLIVDAYDDIRDTSVSTLQICIASMPAEHRETVLMQLPQFISRAEASMLRTGRADLADGVARAYALYFSTYDMESGAISEAPHIQIKKLDLLDQLNSQLKNTLQLAKSNLPEAVNGRPVHGTYAAMRYIFDNDKFYEDMSCADTDQFTRWKQIHDELLDSFDELWSCVQESLCADAPEGHIPDELEEDVSLDTKEILSYCWRGLKEASILLRVIALRAPIGDQGKSMLASKDLEKVGRLCFTQLIELRHRGAFSTVAQTFAAICRRCIIAQDDNLSAFPERWYKETLSSIQAKAHAITRRSGGIPALMTGIIAAEPQTGGKLFPRAMRDLFAEASLDAQNSNIEGSRLPQVHALNCIKEIFMTSRLSIASESYIGAGLELAAKTLNSSIWPIRNCSLMLFKALIERLLGSDEAQDWKEQERTKTSRFSYDNYPSLVRILQGLLDPEGPLKESLDTPNSNAPMDLHGAEGVFPALQILRQASLPDRHRRDILASIRRLLGSPHWHLRDMAARTATTLLRSDALAGTFSTLLTSTEERANSQHGILIYAKYVLRKMLHDATGLETETFEMVLQHLSNWARIVYPNGRCRLNKAIFLDLVSLCGMAIINRPTIDSTLGLWNTLTSRISISPEHALEPKESIGDDLFYSSRVQVFFIGRAIIRSHSLDVMISSDYQSISSALKVLESTDPDACFTAMDTLFTILQLPRPQGPLFQTALILLQIHSFSQTATSPTTLTRSRSILATALANHSARAPVLSLIAPSDLLTSISTFEAQCLTYPPSTVSATLPLLATFLDWTYHTYSTHRPAILHHLARLIRLLRLTIPATNPFDARHAACRALAALQHLWSLHPSHNPERELLLGLALILYDLLTDDDDEIRDLAAHAAVRLFNAHARAEGTIKPAVPALTTHRLAVFLSTHFSTSAHLTREAARRLLDLDQGITHAAETADLFAQRLTFARKESTALFATEKQNLYFDASLDARFWSYILLHLAPAARAGIRGPLTTYAISALSTLVRTVESEGDGALGWSTKGEVFELGVRALCVAGVVLRWEGGEKRGSEVRKFLVEFVRVGKERGLNGTWVSLAERMVVGNVEGVVMEVGKKLGGVLAGFGMK